jgi:hypothetical protein
MDKTSTRHGLDKDKTRQTRIRQGNAGKIQGQHKDKPMKKRTRQGNDEERQDKE